MNQEFDLLMRADHLIAQLKAAKVTLYQDRFGNIVAKTSSHNTVVFLNQFKGTYGEQALSQAELLHKEFGLL